MSKRAPRELAVASRGIDLLLQFGWLLIPLVFLYVVVNDDPFHQYIAGFVVIYALSALGLDWLMGRAGVVSLGNGAIMAFGALTAAYLNLHGLTSFVLVLLVVTVLGGVLGAVLSLPALRLQGVYFALVTLALQIIVVFVGHRYQQTSSSFVAGIPMPSPTIGSYEIQLGRSWLILLGVVLAVVVLLLRNMYRAQPGRSWMAIRENELAARTIGVEARPAKLAAFVGSSALIALSGGLLAYYTGRVSADSFTLTFAISFVVMVILGGLRSMSGVLLGTAIVTIAPIQLGQYAQGLSPFEGGITGWFRTNVFYINSGLFGLLVLVILLYMPRGVVPTLSTALAGVRARIDRRLSPSATLPPDLPDPKSARYSESSGALLRLDNVRLTYPNGALALAGVDLTVARGEIVGIVGRNGVGKTSLMRAITGFYRTEGARVEGQILYEGRRIARGSPVASSRRGVALVPERNKVFAELTVEEHLRHIGNLDVVRSAMPREWALLEQKWKTQAGQLSGGERQLLALAMAVSLEPSLLLVDELSLGLSPVAIDRVVSAIRDLQASEDTTIVVVEQNIGVAHDLCDRVLLMEAGRLLSDGSVLDESVDRPTERPRISKGAVDAAG